MVDILFLPIMLIIEATAESHFSIDGFPKDQYEGH